MIITSSTPVKTDDELKAELQALFTQKNWDYAYKLNDIKTVKIFIEQDISRAQQLRITNGVIKYAIKYCTFEMVKLLYNNLKKDTRKEDYTSFLLTYLMHIEYKKNYYASQDFELDVNDERMIRFLMPEADPVGTYFIQEKSRTDSVFEYLRRNKFTHVYKFIVDLEIKKDGYGLNKIKSLYSTFKKVPKIVNNQK